MIDERSVDVKKGCTSWQPFIPFSVVKLSQNVALAIV